VIHNSTSMAMPGNSSSAFHSTTRQSHSSMAMLYCRKQKSCPPASPLTSTCGSRLNYTSFSTLPSPHLLSKSVPSGVFTIKLWPPNSLCVTTRNLQVDITWVVMTGAGFPRVGLLHIFGDPHVTETPRI
jgi:hypothetical protein